MIKSDEKELMARLLLKERGSRDEHTGARDIAADIGMCYQRACFLFVKWHRRGFYEYGVNLGLGWLTPTGREVACRYELEGYPTWVDEL